MRNALLERAWQNQKARVDIEQKAATEEDRGRLLYLNCSGLQMRLQGMDLPVYFVPGSFHTLADSLRLGWHPRYREVLSPTFLGGTTADYRLQKEAMHGHRSSTEPTAGEDGDAVDQGGDT
jgi:hypothetical protein